nr:MAG TPA: hypothetical protein [Caudoviricetes sp.]
MSKIQHSEKILYLFLCLHTHRFYTKYLFLHLFLKENTYFDA